MGRAAIGWMEKGMMGINKWIFMNIQQHKIKAKYRQLKRNRHNIRYEDKRIKTLTGINGKNKLLNINSV